MNLIEESYKEKQEKPKKMKKIILIFIIITLIAIFVIIGLILSLRETPLTVIKDGQINNDILNVLQIQDNGEIYVPIKRMAKILGYEAYNGEYQALSESANKCYVQCENEVVNLSLNDKRIYQLSLETKSGEEEDYIYYDMQEPVKSINGELCINSEEMEKVFNTNISYDEGKNQILIYTLPYLVQNYSSKVLDFGYEQLDKNFVNNKMIFNNMLVVSKNSGKNVGIIDASTGDIIIDTKYTKVEYLPNIGDCIVSDSNNKYGIVSPTEKRTKIEVNYDDIELIDKDAELYIVKRDNKYGIVDLKGTSKVPVEYDEIGISLRTFEDNHLKNKYLLVDNLIPVRKDKLWGMVDKKGKLVVEPNYDNFGYIATNNKNALNLLVVPEYDVVVACKDKKYTLINKSGQVLFEPVVDDIYMTYENGQYKYFMNYNDQTIEVKDYLDQVGISSAINSTKTPESTPSSEPEPENVEGQENQDPLPEEQEIQNGEEIPPEQQEQPEQQEEYQEQPIEEQPVMEE